jgi:hypothetical protein
MQRPLHAFRPEESAPRRGAAAEYVASLTSAGKIAEHFVHGAASPRERHGSDQFAARGFGT